jgi:DNA end-binding protein Ku
MGGRAILRSSISFGLVSIPVELHPTTQSKAVHFNLLHEKDKSRFPEKDLLVWRKESRSTKANSCTVSNQQRRVLSFSWRDLRRLKTSASREIELVQFLPIAEVDPVYFLASISSQTGPAERKPFIWQAPNFNLQILEPAAPSKLHRDSQTISHHPIAGRRWVN